MKIYDGENIRNVALLGHADTGKTQLASAMLYTAGVTTRLGKVDDGTAAHQEAVEMFHGPYSPDFDLPDAATRSR